MAGMWKRGTIELDFGSLKGNGGLEKKNFFFFSKARKYGEEIKI